VAGDLIPPSSPAGRALPDGGDAPAPAETPQTPAAEAPPVKVGPSPFRSRFGFVFGALAGIAVCAVALAVTLAATGKEDGPELAANWSEWQPSTSRMLDGAADIAAHVGLEYKLDNGDQLTQVRASGLEFQGMDLGVAVQPLNEVMQFLDGDGVMYAINGFGPDGAVVGSKPTTERGQLLRRQALELALYTFRYLDDVTMVAILLPPPAKDTTKSGDAATQEDTTDSTSSDIRAVFYRPGDLLSELQVPLSTTLAPQTPLPKTLTKEEGAKIDSLTLRNLFLASIRSVSADQNYLLLREPKTIG
jgi:hypothetical protein